VVRLLGVVPLAVLVLALGASTTWRDAPTASMPTEYRSSTDGPGGPVLVIADPADPFGRYYGEILSAEGLNEFAVADKSALRASTLARYQVVILARTALSGRQASELSRWVRAGGKLVAMRPDRRLAGLLGLSFDSGHLGDTYLAIDTSKAPGAGLTAATMQFHGQADDYVVNDARTVATLYFDAATPSPYPAVTLRSVGAHGGQAAAFAYDLARSVVYTRQGNPAWAGDERDGVPPVRSDDLFYGAKKGDAQPNWVDLDKVRIPQADEQQRLLANLITGMSLDRVPLPRFWYLPDGRKAAVVLTGDDHGNDGTERQFRTYMADSRPGCSVADWQCVRSTSYVYLDTPISDDAARAYQAAGFEIGLHASTDCADFGPASLNSDMTDQLARFATKWPGLTAPRTNRTHCIAWSDWAGEPKAELAHGIRLDANYYYWPANWVQQRPGMFTGSGMPMRFADTDGSLIDVYQATTDAADDATRVNGNTTDPATSPNVVIPNEAITLMNNALGANGYYGAFTIQVHSDEPADDPGRDQVVDYAMSHGVPVISERQLLTWLDGRNGSKFQNVAFGGDGTLSFSIAPDSRANGLTAMLPLAGRTGAMKSLTRGGAPVAYDTQTIKGVAYAVFTAAAGSYSAVYPPPPPALRSTAPGSGSQGSGASAGDKSAKAVEVLSSRVSAPKFPRLRLSAHSLRPGSGRTLAITLRLARTSRLVLTFRNAKGKVVRQIRVPRKKAGTVLRLRWDGKDRHGHYVTAGTYRFTLTAIGTRYHKTARGSVKVLKRK
jgi:hypothetical protein